MEVDTVILNTRAMTAPITSEDAASVPQPNETHMVNHSPISAVFRGFLYLARACEALGLELPEAFRPVPSIPLDDPLDGDQQRGRSRGQKGRFVADTPSRSEIQSPRLNQRARVRIGRSKNTPIRM